MLELDLRLGTLREASKDWEENARQFQLIAIERLDSVLRPAAEALEEIRKLLDQLTGGGLIAPVIGVAPPAFPVQGQLWFDSASLQMFVYYADGLTGRRQWVPVINQKR